MSFFSKQRANVPQQLSAPDAPQYAVPTSGTGHGFLIFSALIHIAAVVVLMQSWPGGIRHATAQTTTASSDQQQPAARRLAIDIAPPQYCEMDIEKIVARPHADSSR